MRDQLPTIDRLVVARIQQLCSLGLGGQAVIPPLLRELHDLVPSHANEFSWAGPDLELVNQYSESPDVAEIVPLYFTEFYNRREREVLRTFPELMRMPCRTAVGDFHRRMLKREWREFVASDHYNLITRPLGFHKSLQVKVTEHGSSLGALRINRTEREPDFSHRDQTLLEHVAPFFAHALTAAAAEATLVESDDRGLVIATAEGSIAYLSREAGRLLMMACFPEWSPRTDWQSWRSSVVPAPLASLCRRITAVFQDEMPAAAPVWRHRNAWGEFDCRAYLLRPHDSSSSLISITVQHLEPLQVRLLRRLTELPLSERERQFCLLLVGVDSSTAIADRMGISRHTMIAHCRNVYTKLGVHTRAELVNKLRVL